MSSIYDFSTTPANNSASPPQGAPENTMLPGDVNDTFRQLMADIIGSNLAVDATAGDAYVVTLNPAPTALQDRMSILVRFVNGNTTTTPTLNTNSFGAVPIKKYGGQSLIIGDITAGLMGELVYFAAGPRWELLNPIPVPGAGAGVTSITFNSPLTGGTVTSTGAAGVAVNGISNSLIAQMPANTIKGNNTAMTANTADLTVAQVSGMLSLGSAATLNVGTGANQVVQLNGAGQLPSGLVSIGISTPPELPITGSPIGNGGTATIAKSVLQPNTFLAGPASAPANTWGARSIVDADLPNLSVQGTFGNDSGQYYISKLILLPSGRISQIKFVPVANIPGGGGGGTGGGGGASCFPGFAMVEMADGSEKHLDQVRIGDKVKGAYGEANTVLALDRTTLGTRLMFHINREHWTSDEHPHMRRDRTFVSPNMNAIYAEWGKEHPIVVKNGNIEYRRNVGLPEGMVTQMRVGQELLTDIGSSFIETLEIGNATDWPPETQLFNLVLDGSGTYRVDGYVVTGWPNHETFDHITWQPK